MAVAAAIQLHHRPTAASGGGGGRRQPSAGAHHQLHHLRHGRPPPSSASVLAAAAAKSRSMVSQSIASSATYNSFEASVRRGAAASGRSAPISSSPSSTGPVAHSNTDSSLTTNNNQPQIYLSHHRRAPSAAAAAATAALHQRVVPLSERQQQTLTIAQSHLPVVGGVGGLRRKRWQSSLGALTTPSSFKSPHYHQPLQQQTSPLGRYNSTAEIKTGASPGTSGAGEPQLHQRRRAQALAQSLVRIAPISGQVVHSNPLAAASNTSSRLRQATLYARRRHLLEGSPAATSSSNQQGSKQAHQRKGGPPTAFDLSESRRRRATSAGAHNRWSTTGDEGGGGSSSSKWQELAASSTSLASSGGASGGGATAIVKRPKSSPQVTPATTSTTAASQPAKPFVKARRTTATDRRGPVLVVVNDSGAGRGAASAAAANRAPTTQSTNTTTIINNKGDLLQQAQAKRQHCADIVHKARLNAARAPQQQQQRQQQQQQLQRLQSDTIELDDDATVEPVARAPTSEHRPSSDRLSLDNQNKRQQQRQSFDEPARTGTAITSIDDQFENPIRTDSVAAIDDETPLEEQRDDDTIGNIDATSEEHEQQQQRKQSSSPETTATRSPTATRSISSSSSSGKGDSSPPDDRLTSGLKLMMMSGPPGTHQVDDNNDDDIVNNDENNEPINGSNQGLITGFAHDSNGHLNNNGANHNRMSFDDNDNNDNNNDGDNNNSNGNGSKEPLIKTTIMAVTITNENNNINGNNCNNNNNNNNLINNIIIASKQQYDNNIDINIKTEPISDYYDLELRPFARGKFAQVKRCIDKSTKRCFAAKCIKKRRRLVDIRHEILLEIEALKLSYYTKHIVQLFDVFETPNEMILVLEMANGGELQRVLDDEEIIEERIACRMIGQILDGLICLHDNCIAHLDLKPQNILLTNLFPECDVKLCDFGISRRITSDCEIREICGTPDYVAPEILRYDPISLATDMWSLGVLTYVLLSGYSPFGSENKQQTYCNITQATLEFPCEIFDRVSQDAIDFISKLIVLEPSRRLTSRQARQHYWLRQQ